ncbi:MAG: S41 family peptidase [Candidatus Saccharimonadales bacterium]
MSFKKRFKANTLVFVALLGLIAGFVVGLNAGSVSDFLATNLLRQNQSKVNANLPEDLDYTAVENIYDLLRQKYDGQLTVEQLLEGLKSGLAEATGDPYTVYMDSEEAEEFRKSIEGTFSGIGAEIAIKNKRLLIQKPLEDTPAARAGLKPGDYIMSIDGQETADMTIDEAVSEITGPEGTEVTLSIIRNNKPAKDFKITRAQIVVPSVNSELKEGDIGYMELNDFGEDVKTELLAAAQELDRQGAKKYILDLRNNPGGLLQTAVEVADMFLDNKTVVEQRQGEKVEQIYRANQGGFLNGKEVVVLINGGSASASEIVAGALQDHEVATIVGEKSFGKGSVQELQQLQGKTLLKITVARWYTPNGRSISNEGIAPDVKVELTQEDFEADRDPQLQKAIELLKG